MVSTSLQASWTYISTQMKNQRLNVNNMEPGLTMGNNVLQTMLGAPMIWRFNRKTFQIAIAKGSGQDYTIALQNLGRIETQWLIDPTNGGILELNGAQALARVSASKRPQRVAPVYDDNQGNITFRFDAIPDRNYIAYFDYQEAPPKMTSPASTFAPIPDEFGYLTQKGMLSEGAALINDSRFTVWRRDFVAGLLATQDGLDAQAKSIFFEQMMNVGRTASRSQAAGQSGAQGRQI